MSHDKWLSIPDLQIADVQIVLRGKKFHYSS